MSSSSSSEVRNGIKEEQFSRFDVVSDVGEHHYMSNASKCSSEAQMKIMQEWKSLAKDLPESIYVRVYETRVDLLRAAIVGAQGTPYHDGLFFFDFLFPSDYPAKPPTVFFRSFGFRFNPNLYNDGSVCLSLLNTWTGKKYERWNSYKSTILQVLLSLQALVLNEKPYFNEPALFNDPVMGVLGGKNYREKRSLLYNENVFVLNCKAMLLLLRKPPMHFKPLVKQHFKSRAEFILSACDGYRKGLAQVGFFDLGPSEVGKNVEVSGKFKDVMDKMFWDMVNVLGRTGPSVTRFLEQARVEREMKANEKVIEKEEAKKGKFKSLFLSLFES